MKNTLRPFIVAIIIFMMFACSSRNQTSMMKNVTGRAGELVIVISPNTWNSESGSLIKETLGQPQLSLPQDEPIFDLINIPHEAFGEIFKTSRNLLISNIKPSLNESGIAFKRDVHAYTQAIVYINARNQKEMADLFAQNSDRIVAFFMRAERDRLSLNYTKYHDKAVMNTVSERFNIKINVPPGFVVAENNNDFMWIKFETPEISQGILIYSYPYTDDSTFTSKYMIAKRNIILRDNVPGPLEGSYMSTENQLPVVFNVFKYNGNHAAEIRGLWTVVNDFMGGPFVSLSMLDMLNNRIVVLDAYIYAPSKNKRNLLRQVEAMIYTSEFINQEEIDKINKQFDL